MNLHTKPTRIGETAPYSRPVIPVLEAYSIRREIGRGGMAVVYEAIEKSLNRVVALKVLGREFSQDRDLIQRFVNEAQAAARLSHLNIVQIYSIGEENGIYYFAMEYIRGQSVENMLEDRERIPLLDAIDIVKQTVLALQEAYKNNIVHRDIKPGNLLINEQGIVKVADFGLAAEVRTTQVTFGGKIIGTPLYISPEQAQGKEGDYRSDIYSLGITFYQMLTGRPPFVSSDTKVLMKSHIENILPPLAQNIPSPVKRLISRMAEKNPERRYENYESLRRELDAIYKILTRRRYSLSILSLGLLLSIGVTMYSFQYKPAVRDLVLPAYLEKDKQIEGIYKNVVRFARENPESYGDIIKEYFNIIKNYPDTEWAFRAEQKIDMIILAVANEAAEELKRLKSARGELINERRYKEAIDRYGQIKEKYRDTVAESFAQENMDYIIDEARRDFRSLEEHARDYLNNNKFDEARRLYKEVIDNFGVEEFVGDAAGKLAFIDELEKEYGMEDAAKAIFNPIHEQIQGLLADHDYEKARELLRTVKGTDINPALDELVKKELAGIDEMQIEYESAALKEKMESQYNYYNNIINKTEDFISKYKYKNAMDLVKEGITDIEILEWRHKLVVLQERLQYLKLLKDGIITGINRDLADRKVSNISTDEDTLVFVVEGGYVGSAWRESRPQDIYSIAQRYLGDNPDSHMALGILCLTYGLLDSARKEFTMVLRMEPKMQGIVEKYLIQLAEGKEK